MKELCVSWRLPPTFESKASEVRQSVTGLESLQAVPEKAMQEAVKVKPRLWWRLQYVRDARNMGLPRKAVGNK
jgi:hypothetical protein